MVILNVDHPDVVDFIDCKAIEEKKAWALIDAGYDGGFNVVGGAYDSVNYQNANHSVRVTDDFMNAVLRDGEWSTTSVTDGQHGRDVHARATLMRKMADAAWICGDPGMQYDTTINDWHPCINTARINASNPCSRVHVPRRLGVQPRVAEPAQVPARRDGELRHRGVPARGARRRSPRWRSSSTTRATRPQRIAENSLRVPAARPRLREPRRAADVALAAVRQRARPRVRGGDHRADVRRGVSPERARSRPTRPARSSATPRTRRRSSR